MGSLYNAAIAKKRNSVRALVYEIRDLSFFPQAPAMTSQITWIAALFLGRKTVKNIRILCSKRE